MLSIANEVDPLFLIFPLRTLIFPLVIPAEIGLTSFKVENHDENKNDEVMCLQLDLVDEVRTTTEQRLARFQDFMAKQYNSRVRHRDFQVRDLVLRKVMSTTRDPFHGKDLTESLCGRGKTPITWKHLTIKNCITYGTPST